MLNLGPDPKPTANICTPCDLAELAAAIAAESPPSTVCTPSVSTNIVTGTPARETPLTRPRAALMPSEIEVPPDDGPPPAIALSMAAASDESEVSTSASLLNWTTPTRVYVSETTNSLTRPCAKLSTVDMLRPTLPERSRTSSSSISTAHFGARGGDGASGGGEGEGGG